MTITPADPDSPEARLRARLIERGVLTPCSQAEPEHLSASQIARVKARLIAQGLLTPAGFMRSRPRGEALQ